MTLAGWILMLATWTLIIGFAAFCFKKIFQKNKLD
jgi:hypothetical protein